MFNKIRNRLSTYYALRALEEIHTGEFESIMKGLDYMRKSLIVAPPSKEKDRVVMEIRNMAISHKQRQG